MLNMFGTVREPWKTIWLMQLHTLVCWRQMIWFEKYKTLGNSKGKKTSKRNKSINFWKFQHDNKSVCFTVHHVPIYTFYRLTFIRPLMSARQTGHNTIAAEHSPQVTRRKKTEYKGSKFLTLFDIQCQWDYYYIKIYNTWYRSPI